MPLYAYQCSNCQKNFELLVGVVSEQSNLQCPFCGNKDIQKQPSTFSLGNSSSNSSDLNSCSTGSCSTGFCPTCS